MLLALYRELESTVEELRSNVINKKSRVNMSDVENMALVLSKSRYIQNYVYLYMRNNQKPRHEFCLSISRNHYAIVRSSPAGKTWRSRHKSVTYITYIINYYYNILYRYYIQIRKLITFFLRLLMTTPIYFIQTQAKSDIYIYRVFLK